MMGRLALVFVVGAAACGSEGGQSLQLQGALAPETDCTFDSANGKIRGSGSYDPRGYGTYVPDSYVLALEVVNTMPPGTTTATVSSNDVVVAGVEACWDLASKHGSPTFQNGVSFDCGSLPQDQRAFIGSVTPVPAGGKAVIITDVLTPAHLKAAGIFGDAFDPTQLPPTSAPPTSIAGPSFSFPVTVPASNSDRSAAWGTTFPYDPTNSAEVLVQVRAVGQAQNGNVVRSNWIAYPIDVTPGALAIACTPTPFVLTCSGGSTLYAGGFVDVGNSCLPGRGGSVSCFFVTQTSCPTTTP